LGRRVIVIVLASNGSPSIENHETCKEQNNVKLKRAVFALFGCGLHQEPNDLLLQIIPFTLIVLYKYRVNKGESL